MLEADAAHASIRNQPCSRPALSFPGSHAPVSRRSERTKCTRVFSAEKKPRQFSRRGERCDQRELRTADRVFILRQRSTSGKIPPLSAKNVPDAIG